MKLSKEYPPNYEELEKVFDLSGKTAAFCYGDTIYNPFGRTIADYSIAHEKVHSKQQGKDPEAWWRAYIDDVEFRLKQEIEAYGAELKFIRKHYSLIKADQALHSFSTSLSGPVYGRPCSYAEAKKYIYKQSITN